MTDDPIDLMVFADLKDATGAEFAAELVDTFLEEAPAMIAELQQALASGDADQFRRAAHSIKSNANVFGAQALAELARRLELGEFDPSSVAIQAILDELKAEYTRAATALRGVKNG